MCKREFVIALTFLFLLIWVAMVANLKVGKMKAGDELDDNCEALLGSSNVFRGYSFIKTCRRGCSLFTTLFFFFGRILSPPWA